MIEIQKLASSAVSLVLEGRNLNQVLSDTWRQHSKLEPSQKAAIQDIAFGSLRYYGVLNAVLSKLLLKPLNDPLLHALLIITLYQLQYTRAKSFVVVDQAVSAIKFLGQGAAKGLVNAILRNFLRQRESLLKQVSKDSLASLNHPEWWVKKIKSQYPIRWLPMLEAVNHLPPMTLRVNKRRISPDAYLELLKTHDIEATLLGKEAIVLSRPMPVDKLPGFFDGLSSVQDQSAQYSAALLDASAGMSVLDACSAPGGKAGHLLESADIDLTAMDADEERLSRVSDNLQRLGLTAKLLKADAGDVESWWDGKQFDRILLDVPCSGSGVTKRHPDIKWIRRPSDIQQFAEQQKRLLNNLWPTLLLGGKLLYVTCSVFREENEDQISAHLARFNDARRLDINESAMVNGQIIPDEFHDGFFYALLEKV